METPAEIYKTIEEAARKTTEAMRLATPFKSTIDSAYAGGDPQTKQPGESAAGTNAKRSIVSLSWDLPVASAEIIEVPIGSGDTGIEGVIQARSAGSATTGAYGLMPGWALPEATGTYVNSTANFVRVMRESWLMPVLIATVHVEVVTTSAGALASVGIYSAEGNNLLVNSGTFDCASAGIKSNTLGTAVKLLPGFYYYAFTISDTTATLRAVTSGANIQTVMNGGTIQRGQAANNATAGVLPATLGTVSDVSYTNTPLSKWQS